MSDIIFKGSSIRAVDPKGRVSIPSRMRSAIDATDKFVATRSTEMCICIYPKSIWLGIEAKLSRLSQSDEQVRFYLRMLLQWYEDIALDPAGRILLPKNLKDYAEIHDRALVIGVMDHIELWKPLKFSEYAAKKGTYESALKDIIAKAA